MEYTLQGILIKIPNFLHLLCSEISLDFSVLLIINVKLVKRYIEFLLPSGGDKIGRWCTCCTSCTVKGQWCIVAMDEASRKDRKSSFSIYKKTQIFFGCNIYQIQTTMPLFLPSKFYFPYYANIRLN